MAPHSKHRLQAVRTLLHDLDIKSGEPGRQGLDTEQGLRTGRKRSRKEGHQQGIKLTCWLEGCNGHHRHSPGRNQRNWRWKRGTGKRDQELTTGRNNQDETSENIETRQGSALVGRVRAGTILRGTGRRNGARATGAEDAGNSWETQATGTTENNWGN